MRTRGKKRKVHTIHHLLTENEFNIFRAAENGKRFYSIVKPTMSVKTHQLPTAIFHFNFDFPLKVTEKLAVIHPLMGNIHIHDILG